MSFLTLPALLGLVLVLWMVVGASGCTMYVEDTEPAPGERDLDIHVQEPPDKIVVPVPKLPDRVNIHVERPVAPPKPFSAADPPDKTEKIN